MKGRRSCSPEMRSVRGDCCSVSTSGERGGGLQVCSTFPADITNLLHNWQRPRYPYSVTLPFRLFQKAVRAVHDVWHAQPTHFPFRFNNLCLLALMPHPAARRPTQPSATTGQPTALVTGVIILLPLSVNCILCPSGVCLYVFRGHASQVSGQVSGIGDTDRGTVVMVLTIYCTLGTQSSGVVGIRILRNVRHAQLPHVPFHFNNQPFNRPDFFTICSRDNRSTDRCDYLCVKHFGTG